MQLPLHSILVIFHCKLTSLTIYIQDLYIPFWLYSTSNHYPHWDKQYILYIPFWLYSTGNAYANSETVFFFTFHSGYIPLQVGCCTCCKVHCLYIPFWLYSTHNAEGYKDSTAYLYIPFWLYSTL